MIDPPERLAERDAAIDGMLPHVPFDGWSKRALLAGVRSAGLPDVEAELLFPIGIVDILETYCDLADRRMEEAAKSLPQTKLTERVRAVIALRLAQNRAHKDAIRRAMTLFALPVNATAGARSLARTVDAIWYAAGDRSADISWYTKRAILSAIYGATLLYWLRDTSEDDAATLAFLDRRLAGIGRMGKARARVEGLLGRFRPVGALPAVSHGAPEGDHAGP